MRKLFSLFLVLGLGVLLISGCQTASSPIATTTQLPAADAAYGIGMMASGSLNAIEGIIGFTNLPASGVKALTITMTSPEVGVDGWWTMAMTEESSTATIESTINFRFLDPLDAPITTEVGLRTINDPSDLSEFDLFCISAYQMMGETFNIYIGNSKSDPLKLTASAGIPHISGPVKLIGVFVSENIEFNLNYSNLIFSTGYPNGRVDFSIYSNDLLAVRGYLQCDGDTTAALSFTDGFTGTYNINLTTGDAVLATSL